MRLMAVLVLAAATGWAQRAPAPTGFGRLSNPAGVVGTTGGAGFGRLIYPGTGAPATARNPRIPGAPLVALPPPEVAHRPHGTFGTVAYPVFYGGGFYDYDAPQAPVAPYSPSAYQVPGYDQMTQPPVVIINQYFKPDTANPVIRDYSNTPLPEPGPQYDPQANNGAASTTGDQQVMFLIALKDHTIFPAVAYWVEGDTLNYITVQGVKNSVSLDLVDREFSRQINKERKVEFGLPSK
ncbi:MAG: hypothetical protein JWO19_2921 [Bryobacterales bacterium]|nr:hypothetical protein [Bryobacterales bacterium]